LQVHANQYPIEVYIRALNNEEMYTSAVVAENDECTESPYASFGSTQSTHISKTLTNSQSLDLCIAYCIEEAERFGFFLIKSAFLSSNNTQPSSGLTGAVVSPSGDT
jgi:hypothetical protein